MMHALRLYNVYYVLFNIINFGKCAAVIFKETKWLVKQFVQKEKAKSHGKSSMDSRRVCIIFSARLYTMNDSSCSLTFKYFVEAAELGRCLFKHVGGFNEAWILIESFEKVLFSNEIPNWNRYNYTADKKK